MVAMYDEAWLDEVLPLQAVAAPRIVTRAVAMCDLSAAAIGYRCQSGRWLRLAPSVYLVAPPATPLDRLQAAALHGGPGCVVSGAAALIEYGFRVARPGAESWPWLARPATSRVGSAYTCAARPACRLRGGTGAYHSLR